MKIICPACKTSFQLPDSQDGSRVRCGSCSHVFVARERGAKRSSGSPTPWILGGALVLGVLVVVWIARQPDAPAPGPVLAAQEPVERAPSEPTEGWDAPPVRAARALHDAAARKDALGVAAALDVRGVYEARRAAAQAAGAEAPPAWETLPRDEQVAYRETLVESLLAGGGEDEALVRDWAPFDGDVAEASSDQGVERAVVRLSISPRDPKDAQSRTIEWRLARDGERWRASSWARWVSPEEQKAQRVAKSKLTEKRTLSDGSIVIEAELRKLEHLEDTPPELRARIDQLYTKAIDLALSPKESDRALNELIAIGKPAIPILLSGFYEIPLQTEEQAIQVNRIVLALREITGQYFGYKPQVVEGSGTGTTAERRESALKQWFGWWQRKGAKFTAKAEGEDLLEETVIPTAREQREIERFEKQQQSKKP